MGRKKSKPKERLLENLGKTPQLEGRTSDEYEAYLRQSYLGLHLTWLQIILRELQIPPSFSPNTILHPKLPDLYLRDGISPLGLRLLQIPELPIHLCLSIAKGNRR